MNARMPELRAAFEGGFTEVKTLLSSGNVVFSAPVTVEASLQRKAEAAMTKRFGAAFLTIVRPIAALRELLERDPYRAFRLKPRTKRIVTFLRDRPVRKLTLPIEFQGARILAMQGGEVFSAYVPNPKGPVFMTLIEKTFGAALTTRTGDTVRKWLGVNDD